MARYKVHDSINKKKRELLDSLGDDILRYVAELVTNSDDSYRREEKSGNMPLEEEKVIYVEICKDKRNGGGDMIVITDNAEGMSLETLKDKFISYEDDKAGGADLNVRGLFGRGASDVLRVASHEKKTAKIESIKDGQLSRLKYITEENYDYTIDVEPVPVRSSQFDSLRKSMKIPNNGTVISFGIPSNVKYNRNIKKKFKDLMETYPSFRYLLNQANRKVILIVDGVETVLSSEPYSFENMIFLVEKTFDYHFQGKVLECCLKVYRNDNKQVDGTQIIVTDQEKAVYDNTMFDFGNMASAKNISGELTITGLYQVCHDNLYDKENPNAIFKVNRTGFDNTNTFYKGLNQLLTPIIDSILKEHGAKVKSTDLTNNKKISDALKKLNKYIKNELRDSISGGNLSGQEPPTEGIKFVRAHASITCGKTYDLKLLINSAIIGPTDTIKVTVDENDCIEVTPSTINYLMEDIKPNGLVVKDVVIKSLQVTNEPITIEAFCNGYKAIILIDVIEQEIHDPENGFEFYQKELVLSPDEIHKASLYYDKDVVPEGSTITFECEGLELLIKEHVTSSDDLLNESIGCIIVKSKGGEIGSDYVITAKVQDVFNELTASVKITITEPSKNKNLGGGLISKIRWVANEGQFFQAYYQNHTHELIINSKNPVNMALMGSMDDRNPDNPKLTKNQRRFLCDLIAFYGAQILVKENNAANGEINIGNTYEAIEDYMNLIQQHKNAMFNDMYPVLVESEEQQ